MRKLVVALSLIGLMAAPAMADVVTLADGSKREGKVVKESDTEVVLQVTQGRLSAEITFKKEEVKGIERGPTAAEKALAEVERRKAEVKATDAAALLELARWLDRQPGFSRDAAETYEKVLRLEPDNAAARARLGYQKVGDKWLTEAQLMAAQGYVYQDGRWVKPEERKAAPASDGKIEDLKIALAEEVRRQRTEEDAAAQAKRLSDWQLEMLNRAAQAAANQPPNVTSVRSGGVVLGPYGYGYYGVTTSDGQYLQFVPATGGVMTVYNGVWLGGCGPVIVGQSGTSNTSVGGFSFQYQDKHFNIQFNGANRR